ncbi:MAG: tetratricopeptide repeat protein [Planctomycetota bacterium]|nr:tetratricopeptide repeat protein [Planctomycetota bacterium]
MPSRSYPLAGVLLTVLTLASAIASSGCASCEPISSWRSDRYDILITQIPEGWCLEEESAERLILRRLHRDQAGEKFWETFRLDISSAPGGESEVARTATSLGYEQKGSESLPGVLGFRVIRFLKEDLLKSMPEQRLLWVAVGRGVAFAAELVASSSNTAAEADLASMVEGIQLGSLPQAVALYERAERGEAPFEEALAALDARLSTDNPDGRAYLYRGVVNLRLGRAENALSDLAEALRLDPEDPEVHRYRGHALFLAERYEEAAESWMAAVDRKPGLASALDPWLAFAESHQAEALYERGVAKADQDRPEEAVGAFNRALERAPDMIKAMIARGAALNDLGRHQEAAADFNQAIRRDPLRTEAFVGRGASRFHVEEYEGAIEDASWALKRGTSRRETAHRYRGMALFRLGRLEEAESDLAESLKGADGGWRPTIEAMLREIRRE